MESQLTLDTNDYLIKNKNRVTDLAQRIHDLDDGTRTAREVARLVGCSKQNVLANRKRRGGYSARRRPGLCKRCELPGWDENPVGPDGLCQWCQLELAGHDLARLYRLA